MVPPKPPSERPPDLLSGVASDARGPIPPAPTAAVAAELRQRWRLTVRRRPDAPATTSRDLLAAWEAGFAASGLPIAGLELPAARPRIVFGAPLPANMPADRELLDVFLTARCPVGLVRDAIEALLPPGHELTDLHDVWLGEPPLPGQVAAADYRLRVRSDDGRSLDLATLQAACDQVVASRTLPRTRDKGGRAIAYDLRPLLASATAIRVDPDGLATLRIRTRFDPERGVGRPEEVVAAIGDSAGIALEVVDIVRERLLLIGEP